MTKLADVAEMTFGFAFKSAEFTDSPGDIRLLRGDNIAQGRLRWDGAKRFPSARIDEVKEYELDRGDVVIAMDRPWISAGLKYSVVRNSDIPSLLVQRVARLRAKAERLDQGFLAAIIGSRAFADYVIGVQTGSAVPHISGGQIGAFEFDLPNIQKQKAIAAMLSALEDKIESDLNAQVLSLELANALFTKLAATAPTQRLGDLSTVILGGTPSRTRPDYWIDGTVPWINSGAANQDVILEPTELITEAALRSSAAKLMPAGATVIAITGATLGQVAILGIATSGNQSLVGVWSDRESLSTWLYFCLRSSVEELVKSATGAAQQHVNKADVASLIIPVPEEARLAEWAEAAIPLVRRSVQLAREARRLSSLRDALLPGLLSGRFRLGEPEAALE